MPKIKVTTATILVEELLRRDARLFLTGKMVRERLPQLSGNQVSAALYHLKKYGVADFVVEADQSLWWFALDKACDRRTRVVVELTPESKKRRRRAPRRKEGAQ